MTVIILWVLLATQVLSAITVILYIDKTRDPVSSRTAVIIVGINLIYAITLYTAIQELRA
jgi:hypothetical protein